MQLVFSCANFAALTRYLVYNARVRSDSNGCGEKLADIVPFQKRGGDLAADYFRRTEDIAGVKDNRFQPLMSDVLVWLGIKKITNLISMSDMKADAIKAAGIEIVNRYEIPPELLPSDSLVEIDAKIQAGYFSSRVVTEEDLKRTVGQAWENIHQ